MTDNLNYKNAYCRQKKAREYIENILEDRSRALYDVNKSLRVAYDKLKDQKTQLLHQEKLASIGQLSAGVAHEINNPTSYVKSNLNTLRQYFDTIKSVFIRLDSFLNMLENEADRDVILSAMLEVKRKNKADDIEFLLDDIGCLLEESVDGAVRIAEIVQGLKDFSRTDSDAGDLVNINQCLETTLKLANSELKDKAEIIKDFGDIPETLGMQGGLNQVFLNLLVNAAQAMDSYGQIYVKTESYDDNIYIAVSDTGSGIRDDDIANIFNPFFTTKDVGSGTGLGLSISHGIIKKHGGIIEVESELGVGTKFTITLPVKAQVET